MLFAVLSGRVDFPLLGLIVNGAYYAMILTGIAVSTAFMYRKLARAGYEKTRLRAFFLTCLVLILPLGVIGSRAANMFYHPPAAWSPLFLWQQLWEGPHHTYHGAILLPVAAVLVLSRLFALNAARVSDTLFLCIPLGHAISRGGCLLAGCCWGKAAEFSIAGYSFSFRHPVPLYAMVINLALFAGLWRLYGRIYEKGPSRGCWLVTAAYLAGYGTARFALERLRTEIIVGWGLTQAQWTMLLFIAAGIIITLAVGLNHDAGRTIRTVD